MWPQNRFVFELPACAFVVALNLEWCPDANEATVNRECHEQRLGSFASPPDDRRPISGQENGGTRWINSPLSSDL